MASSVSSERAFSQGGITISKRRNRLKGDIVEAIQCLKCSLRNDLLFREAGPSSLDEEEYQDGMDLQPEGDTVVEVDPDELGWETLLVDDDDFDFNDDIDMYMDDL